MTVLLCSVFSILRYKEHKPYFHQNILYLTWTRSSNSQLFHTGPPAYGEIVELMPRPAYGMKGEENLDM